MKFASLISRSVDFMARFVRRRPPPPMAGAQAVPVPIARTDVYDRLRLLRPTQIDEVILRLHLRPDLVSPGAPSATRALEIVHLCEQSPGGLGDLQRVIDEVRPHAKAVLRIMTRRLLVALSIAVLVTFGGLGVSVGLSRDFETRVEAYWTVRVTTSAGKPGGTFQSRFAQIRARRDQVSWLYTHGLWWGSPLRRTRLEEKLAYAYLVEANHGGRTVNPAAFTLAFDACARALDGGDRQLANETTDACTILGQVASQDCEVPAFSPLNMNRYDEIERYLERLGSDAGPDAMVREILISQRARLLACTAMPRGPLATADTLRWGRAVSLLATAANQGDAFCRTEDGCSLIVDFGRLRSWFPDDNPGGPALETAAEAICANEAANETRARGNVALRWACRRREIERFWHMEGAGARNAVCGGNAAFGVACRALAEPLDTSPDGDVRYPPEVRQIYGIMCELASRGQLDDTLLTRVQQSVQPGFLDLRMQQDLSMMLRQVPGIFNSAVRSCPNGT